MGQAIEVEVIPLGDVVVFDTDRSISGQDGESYSSAEEAQAGSTFPARLAAELLASDDEIANVYILSNTVSVQRHNGWTGESTDRAAQIIRNFFIFYDENRQEPSPG